MPKLTRLNIRTALEPMQTVVSDEECLAWPTTLRGSTPSPPQRSCKCWIFLLGLCVS